MLSRRAAGRVLFAAAVLALPLPWFLGEFERAPLVRLAFFTALLGSVLVSEGPGGTTGIFVALGTVQTLLYGVALRLAAALLARVLAGLPSPAWHKVVVVALAVALLGAGLLPIYHTPLSSSRPRSSLLGLFE